RNGMTLIGGNDERVRRSVPGNRSLLHRIKIAQPTFAVVSHVVQSARRRRQLVIDDVAQMPLARTPERGKLPTDGSRIVTETGTQVAEILLDGRGVLNAGSLCQDTNGPVVVLVSSRRHPRVVY